MPPSRQRGGRRASAGLARDLTGGAFQLAAKCIDRFGWPGGTLVLAYVFVERHATTQQKQEIIEMVIHPGSPGAGRLGMLLLLFGAIFYAQHLLCAKRVQTMQREIDRLAEWKTQHQQAPLPSPLHHTGKATSKAASHKEGGKG